MHIHEISEDNYFGECQECGKSDIDTKSEKILEKIENLVWSQLQDLDLDEEF